MHFQLTGWRRSDPGTASVEFWLGSTQCERETLTRKTKVSGLKNNQSFFSISCFELENMAWWSAQVLLMTLQKILARSMTMSSNILGTSDLPAAPCAVPSALFHLDELDILSTR